jgi:hypothetical protein
MTARRWLAAPLAAAVVAAGVWVAGGVITDDFRVSMALTGGWFAISGLAALVIGLRRRPLRAPLIAGYVVSAAAIGTFLALTTLRDRVVDEKVATGVPVTAAPAAAQPSKPAQPAKQNMQVATGRFESLEHESTGVASIVEMPSGKRVLTLTEFETSAGPDLRVRLVVGDTSNGASDGAIDLGALKGNKGNQQYDLPARADPRRHTTVVIWCRAFSAAFAKATLG